MHIVYNRRACRRTYPRPFSLCLTPYKRLPTLPEEWDGFLLNLWPRPLRDQPANIMRQEGRVRLYLAVGVSGVCACA